MGFLNKIKKVFQPDDEEEIDDNVMDEQEYEEEEKEEFPLLEPNGYNFSYLDNLIYSGEDTIVLEHDIILTEDELGHFTQGIYIGIDNICIDGNGHTIDAQKKTRIFEVAAKNITIKNVTLQNAYLYEEGGGAIRLLENCSLVVENTHFLHNYGKYGGAIESLGELIIRDSTFSDNISFFYGGAIRMAGKFRLEGSNLINNKAGYDGGAIYNNGISFIEDCTFSNNTAKFAGAIDNWKELSIFNTKIEDNKARDASAVKNYQNLTINNSTIKNNTKDNESVIYNDSGIIKIIQSDISENQSENYVIYNNDTLVITDSNITMNASENIILNDAKLALSGGKISYNTVSQSILFNNASSSISKTAFDNGNVNIQNEGELILDNAKIEDENIVNHGNITYEDINNSINETKETNDFTNLEYFIKNSEDNHILLDDDYKIQEYEIDYYEGGIELDRNNLVIDGQNHIIDGNDLSRIFIVTGNNITLKNITFKNGHSYHNYDKSLNNNGGVIRNNSMSNLNISNCKFTDNISESSGGVIDNEGYMKITESYFTNNTGKGKEFGGGGAIYNHNKLSINDSTLNNNAYMGDGIHTGGGAVFNDKGEIELYNSNLNENTVEKIGGGSISNNQGRMEIVGCSFTKNLVKEESDNITGGGAIFSNDNVVSVKDCKFQENHANNGGAINNWGTFYIENSVISDNSSCYNSGSIYNLGKEFVMKNSILKNNNSVGRTSIKNDMEGAITITNSTIEENATNIDEIIDTNDDDKIIIENCFII